MKWRRTGVIAVIGIHGVYTATVSAPLTDVLSLRHRPRDVVRKERFDLTRSDERGTLRHGND